MVSARVPARPLRRSQPAGGAAAAKDPDEVFSACLDKCGANEKRVQRCVDDFKRALGAEDAENEGEDGAPDDVDQDGSGRGGDARCCVGRALWVCHATGSNGASCNANASPPGDGCERAPALDAMCQ